METKEKLVFYKKDIMINGEIIKKDDPLLELWLVLYLTIGHEKFLILKKIIENCLKVSEGRYSINDN